MRGKLRDKRTTTKRDSFRRESIEHQRPGKRDNRSIVRLNLQMEDDEFELDIEEEGEGEETEEKIEVPQKK